MVKRHSPGKLFILAFLVPAALCGQEVQKDTAKIALEEVTITAYRLTGFSGAAARSTKIITDTEIRSLPVHDLAGVLEYVPDLDIRQRGPLGVQSDLSIRGGTFDQYSILINGINFNDPQTGHFNLDIPIPVSMIRSIEILPGSDVKSLGANALTGTINIVTGKPQTGRFHAGIGAGQHGFIETVVDGGGRQGIFWQQAGGSWQKSDGYIANTDFRNLGGFFQAGCGIRRMEVSLMAGGLSKAFGANSFYSAKYPGQFETTGTGFTAIQASIRGRVNINESVYYRLHSDEFTLFRSDAPVWYKSPNYHLTQLYGSKTDVSFTTVLGTTAFGLEARREWIWSTVLGETGAGNLSVPGHAGLEYDHYGSRKHFSLSAEQQVSAGRFTLNGGLVLHQVTATRNWLQVYPGLDVGFMPAKPIRTYVSVNRAFRLPTFTELYYQSPVNRGNAALLPETAWHGETGVEFNRAGISAKAAIFSRYATQSIDWVRSDEETVWHTENLGRIVTTGFESSLVIRPGGKQLSGIVERFEFGFRRYFQHHETGELHSQYILDYLKWKVSAGINIHAGKPFMVAVRLLWQDRNGTYTAFDAAQKPVEMDYRPFALADIKISYRYRWLTVIAECSNLFNTSYFDIGNVPQPGAWFKAGAEINLLGRK